MSKRDEIRQLTEAATATGEALTAEKVVEAARNEQTYPFLHAHLWGISEAELAGEARISRAHRLIISLHVTVGDGVTTRLLVHTRGVAGYHPYPAVAATPNLASMKLAQLTEDIARARGRLRSFRAVLPEEVSAEIDEALAQAEAKAAAAVMPITPERPAAASGTRLQI